MGYEWWPMVHCMYGLQNCLNYNASAEARANNQTAEKAERGVDDDLELSGDDVKGLKEVECSLTGVVDFCASKHTSTDLATLTSCVESDGPSYAKASDKTAQAANGGVPLWVNLTQSTRAQSAASKSRYVSRLARGVPRRRKGGCGSRVRVFISIFVLARRRALTERKRSAACQGSRSYAACVSALTCQGGMKNAGPEWNDERTRCSIRMRFGHHLKG